MRFLAKSITNSHKDRRFLRLRKKVGLHYIGFEHIKPNSKPKIDDFAPKILEIFPQQRNLG